MILDVKPVMQVYKTYIEVDKKNIVLKADVLNVRQMLCYILLSV